MTILRESEHTALRSVALSGAVLDLGGEKRSEYGSLFKGSFAITTVNMNEEVAPDITADLEQPLPIPDASYDAVLLINVLEHIYEYRALLTESSRVLRPEGKVVIVVPYMFPYHPSPSDFHRFSKEALGRALGSAGFTDIAIVPLGTGVFSTRWLFLERLLPGRMQDALSPFTHALARGLDASFTSIANAFDKKYDPADYALGFLVTASKQ